MIRVHTSALLFAISAAIAIGTPTPAHAQVDVGVGVGLDVETYPPAAYIATSQPEYFDGRAVYFYNDYWFYRDHGRWSYYRSEPGYLHNRRSHWGGGYRMGGYGRGGYAHARGNERGGYARGNERGYARGNERGGSARGGGQPGRYHYRR